MAGSQSTSGSGPGNPDRVPTTIVFDSPPGIAGMLLVGAEHGDITVHVEINDKLFCTCVVTADDALTLSMWLCAHVVDERRRRQG